MLWGGLELESREVTLGEIPLGSNHAERVFYNLLEFSTAYRRSTRRNPAWSRRGRGVGPRPGDGRERGRVRRVDG